MATSPEQLLAKLSGSTVFCSRSTRILAHFRQLQPLIVLTRFLTSLATGLAALLLSDVPMLTTYGVASVFLALTTLSAIRFVFGIITLTVVIGSHPTLYLHLLVFSSQPIHLLLIRFFLAFLCYLVEAILSGT